MSAKGPGTLRRLVANQIPIKTNDRCQREIKEWGVGEEHQSDFHWKGEESTVIKFQRKSPVVINKKKSDGKQLL